MLENTLSVNDTWQMALEMWVLLHMSVKLKRGQKATGEVSNPFVGFPEVVHISIIGHDTRSIQHYLGHKNIQHTVRYTQLSPS